MPVCQYAQSTYVEYEQTGRLSTLYIFSIEFERPTCGWLPPGLCVALWTSYFGSSISSFQISQCISRSETVSLLLSHLERRNRVNFWLSTSRSLLLCLAVEWNLLTKIDERKQSIMTSFFDLIWYYNRCHSISSAFNFIHHLIIFVEIWLCCGLIDECSTLESS